LHLEIRILSFIFLPVGDEIPQGISEWLAHDALRRVPCDIMSDHAIIARQLATRGTTSILGPVSGHDRGYLAAGTFEICFAGSTQSLAESTAPLLEAMDLCTTTIMPMGRL
jgi:hypothetical protein